jgi:hypothetical protein
MDSKGTSKSSEWFKLLAQEGNISGYLLRVNLIYYMLMSGNGRKSQYGNMEGGFYHSQCIWSKGVNM